MNFKKIFVCITALFLISAIDSYELITKIAFSNKPFVTTDKMGNAFVILGRQLLEFDKIGKPLGTFSRSNLGDLQSIDASNPLKLLLFYPDFAQLVILNNKLAEQATINLRNSGINQPVLACVSDNGGYWIFDGEDDQLKKLDLSLQISSQSGNLTQSIGLKLHPNYILEEGNNVYMNDFENGIFVFDQFGTYYKTLPFKGLNNFQVVEDIILYLKDNRLYKYNSKTATDVEVLLPPHDSLALTRFEQGQLYLLTSDSLSFYSF